MIKVAVQPIFPIAILISNDIEELRAMKFTYRDGTPHEVLVDEPMGCAFSGYWNDSFLVCIYLSKPALERKETWVHEGFHAAQIALESIGVDLVEKHDEVYAYMNQYIYRCIEEFVDCLKTPKDMWKKLQQENPRAFLLEDLDPDSHRYPWEEYVRVCKEELGLTTPTTKVVGFCTNQTAV